MEGKVYCWGRNSHGQLGNGTFEDALIPVPVRPAEPAGPEPGPVELAAEVLSASEVRLEWSTSLGGVDTYQLERRRGFGGAWTGVVTTDTTAWVDEDLEPGSVYWYRVAVCVPAECVAGEPVEVETHPAIPHAPTEVRLELVVDGIRVAWLPPESRVERNEVERRTDAGPWEPIEETYRVDVLDTDVVPGPTYSYRVRACNVSGCSAFTAAEEIRIAEPGPPGGLIAEPYAMLESRVRWQEPAGIVDDYVLERRVGAGTWDELARTEELEHPDAGLDFSTAYGYRVRACNAFGCSERSDPVLRTTPAEPAPVEGRLVVPRGLTGGAELELFVHIVDDVNELGDTRRVETDQVQTDVAVRGTELWISNSQAALMRIELTTGEVVQRIHPDELLDVSGLPGLTPHWMMAPRPDGGVLISPVFQGGAWRTAVFDPAFSGLEALVPFAPWAGVAFDDGGEEVWYLLGTRTAAEGEDIELMIVRDGRIDGAEYVLLREGAGSDGAPTPPGAASEGASENGTVGKEHLVVDPAGVAWALLNDGSLHRISGADGSHSEIDLDLPTLNRHMAVGPDYVYIVPVGDGMTFPGPAEVWRIPSDLAGALERFASLGDPERPWLNPDFRDVAVDPLGRRLYVAAGTWNNGPLFGPQRIRIYAFDLSTGRLIERPVLGGYGRPTVLTW